MAGRAYFELLRAALGSIGRACGRTALLGAAAVAMALVSTCISAARAPTGAQYDPLQTFAPLTLSPPPSRYRSAGGIPGPSYWQSRADYEIHATLQPESKRLTGAEVITYTNNSPDVLKSLWLQLDQNTYKQNARSRAADVEQHSGFTEGIAIDSLSIQYAAGPSQLAFYLISDTRMQIRLPRPLAGHGGKLRVHIRYHYVIPGTWGGRTSWISTKFGDIYCIAQWYPRMAVYDDIRGWDALPFLGEEFYLEYGTFDYYLNVPGDMIVAGSGKLMNPVAVLTSAQRHRLEVARTSDATVVIRSAKEVLGTQARRSQARTWHFHMENSRDVAFAASRAFVWDAARIRVTRDRDALAMSFYPIESTGPKAWGRSAEYVKHAVEGFSRRWTPYPYPVAVSVAGGPTGMEYPAMMFVGIKLTGKDLFAITAHEVGHTWFPMMVGFDERRHAWMDEGFNTFIDLFESEDFAFGVFAPKRDVEFAPGGGNPVEEIVRILTDTQAPPVMTRADSIGDGYGHPVSYFKSALGLLLLREQILGPERFDWAFREFIRAWTFKHPQPADFFRAMESESGEDLSWFWRGWYVNNWTLDLAVTGVSYNDGDPSKGAEVVIKNRDPLVLPAIVEIIFADRAKMRIRLPVETWIRKTEATLHIDSGKRIVAVIVDPDHVLPDRDRRNNVLRIGPN